MSPANAIGTMQVIPSSGEWASDLVGRKLNLLDPYDNATAGVAIIRQLVRTSSDLDYAIAGYYQGQYSVSQYGMYEDTKQLRGRHQGTPEDLRLSPEHSTSGASRHFAGPRRITIRVRIAC